MSKYEEIKKAYNNAQPKWWFTNEASEAFEWLLRRVGVLEGEAEPLKTELEQHKKFIADAADNHIELCRSLGTHRPIHEAGCFGVTECLNCFRVGFAVLEHAKRRNTQLIAEVAEASNLITQYRKRLADVSADSNALLNMFGAVGPSCPDVEAAKQVWSLMLAKKVELDREVAEYKKSDEQRRVNLVKTIVELEDEKANHQKTAKQFVDMKSIVDYMENAIATTLDPVREWYDGDGRETDNIAMLREAIADLQKERRDRIALAAEFKRLWDSHQVPVLGEEWYSLQEIHEWLIRKDYSLEIAEEIGGLFTKHLQKAFNKGMEVGLRGAVNRKESAELSAAHVRIAALEEDWKRAVEFIEYVRDAMHLNISPEIKEIARKVLEGEDW